MKSCNDLVGAEKYIHMAKPEADGCIFYISYGEDLLIDLPTYVLPTEEVLCDTR